MEGCGGPLVESSGVPSSRDLVTWAHDTDVAVGERGLDDVAVGSLEACHDRGAVGLQDRRDELPDVVVHQVELLGLLFGEPRKLLTWAALGRWSIADCCSRGGLCQVS